MGFFDSLKKVLGGHHDHPHGHPDPALSRAWGLDEAEVAPSVESSEYDRAQWVRRLKRVLDELPGSRGEWDEVMADARALGFEPGWVLKTETEEFLMLVRRAVSDRKFTDAEHRKLDLARDLIGIPEAEAEAALHAIVAEAEKFFGRAVEGA